MECKICQLPKSKFFCNTCSSNHLREYNAALSHIISSRDTHISNARAALEGINPWRIKRAEKAQLTEKVTSFTNEVRRVREECDTVRSRVALRRQTLQTRRDNLERARFLPPQETNSFKQEENEQKEALQKALQGTFLSLAHARAGLVSELVEVFDIAQLQHPKDREKGLGNIHKREFMILGHTLPVPGDLTRLLKPPSSSLTSSISSLSASSFLSLTPTDANPQSPPLSPLTVNATITHILHFLQLLTFYLGVKLPFEITWSTASGSTYIDEGLVGVGHPYIGAASGTYTGPYPLFIPSQSSSKQTDSERDRVSQEFPKALTLLLYNISYLSYTQGLTPTLSGAGEVLRNVWHIIYSPELGRKSHAPSLQPLPPIVGMGFAMDIEQLMQAQAVGSKRERKDSGRERDRRKGKTSTKTLEIVEEDGDEGWDLV